MRRLALILLLALFLVSCQPPCECRLGDMNYGTRFNPDLGTWEYCECEGRMMNLTELLDTGYWRRPPIYEGEKIDAEVAEENPCCKCGSPCTYEGWHNRAGSYIALAVCQECGYTEEF